MSKSPILQQAMSELLLREPSEADPVRLTLDPSPKSTGWMRARNVRDCDGGTRYWPTECRVSLQGPLWISAIGRRFSGFVQDQITTFGVQELVLEMPATPAPDRYNIWHSGYTTHLFFKAIEIAEHAGLPWRAVPTSKLKMWALGQGYGNAPARALIAWASAAGYRPGTEHQAVAIAVLEWARANPS